MGIRDFFRIFPGPITAQAVHSYDEALEIIGNGWLQYLMLFVSGFSLMAVISEGLMMAFVLPAARCEFAITRAQQGLINGVGFLGVIISCHLWGFLSDTWGRRKVLLAALASTFCCSVVSSFSIDIHMLMVMRFFVGFCVSGLQASAISYLGEFHCNSRRAMFVTFAAAFLPTATAFQPLLALGTLPLQWRFNIGSLVFAPWRMHILLSSSIMIFPFVALLFLPESPKFLLAMGKKQEAVDVLRWMYHKNTGEPMESCPINDILSEQMGNSLANAKGCDGVLRLMWQQTWPLFVPPHLLNMLLLSYLLFTMFFVAHGFYMWLPQMLTYYEDHIGKAVTVCQGIALGVPDAVINRVDLRGEPSMFTIWSLFVLPDPAPFFHSNIYAPIANGLNQSFPIALNHRDLALRTQCQSVVNTMVYTTIAIIGTCFVLIYVLVAFSIKRVGKKTVFSVWILTNALSTFAVTWTQSFYLNMFFLMFLLSGASCGSCISAISADLFPTHFKGMALCVIMMFCRIGAVVGSIVVGAMIFDLCQALFLISGALMSVAAVVNFYIFRNVS